MKIQSAITKKLDDALQPEHLEVLNESSGHNVPAGSESHFKVIAVAQSFSGLGSVKRHQLIYQLLDEELAGGVHALALHTFTPEEWHERGIAPASPDCLGGAKR